MNSSSDTLTLPCCRRPGWSETLKRRRWPTGCWEKLHGWYCSERNWKKLKGKGKNASLMCPCNEKAEENAGESSGLWGNVTYVHLEPWGCMVGMLRPETEQRWDEAKLVWVPHQHGQKLWNRSSLNSRWVLDSQETRLQVKGSDLGHGSPFWSCSCGIWPTDWPRGSRSSSPSDADYRTKLEPPPFPWRAAQRWALSPQSWALGSGKQNNYLIIIYTYLLSSLCYSGYSCTLANDNFLANVIGATIFWNIYISQIYIYIYLYIYIYVELWICKWIF